jgi:hypothetical protein
MHGSCTDHCPSAVALCCFLQVYTPSKVELNDLISLRSAAINQTNTTLQGLEAFALAQTPPNAELGVQVAAQNQTFYKLGDPSKKWISNSGIIKSMQNASALQAGQLQA